MYIAIFDASFIVPVFLDKLCFVNLVFSVLGSSLLRCVVFQVIGNNRNISPEYPTNNSCGVSSNNNRSHLENYRNEEVSVLALAYHKC